MTSLTAPRPSAAYRDLALLARLRPDIIEAAGTRAQARTIVYALRRVQVPLVAKWTPVYADLFMELGNRVGDAAEGLGLPEQVPQVFMEANVTHQADQLVHNILNASGLRVWAGDRLTPAFIKHWEDVLSTTARALIKAGLATNIRGAGQTAVLQAGGRRAGLVDILGDTRTALFRALDQAQQGGLGPRQTARLIRDIVPEGRFVNAGSRYRAQLIARTETLHAQRASSLKHYQANRIAKVVAFDGDSDEVCAGRNGEIFNLDDAEIEMDDTHPNCVLAFGPVNP